MALRQFLYYDESLVDDFLSQLEGGQAGEVKNGNSYSVIVKVN